MCRFFIMIIRFIIKYLFILKFLKYLINLLRILFILIYTKIYYFNITKFKNYYIVVGFFIFIY